MNSPSRSSPAPPMPTAQVRSALINSRRDGRLAPNATLTPPLRAGSAAALHPLVPVIPGICYQLSTLNYFPLSTCFAPFLLARKNHSALTPFHERLFFDFVSSFPVCSLHRGLGRPRCRTRPPFADR